MQTARRQPLRPSSRRPKLVPALCSTVLLFAVAQGCHCDSAELPLEVWYDGCASVQSGPTCLLDEKGELLLWVKTATDAQIEIEFGENATIQEIEPLGGGKRYKVSAIGDCAIGRVTAQNDTGTGKWKLAIAREPEEPQWLADARRLRREPKTEEAIALVAPHLADKEPTWRARALGLRGRLAMDQGQIEQACDWLEQAGSLNTQLGHDSEALEDLTALAYQHLEFTRKFEQARVALEKVRVPARHLGSSIYYASRLAQLAALSGDLRKALRQTNEAISLATRSERTIEKIGLSLDLSNILRDIGQYRKAAALIERLREELPEQTPACLRLTILNNEGWLLVLQGEDEQAVAADPIALFEQALALLDGPCPLPGERTAVRLNLALAKLQQGRLDEAAADLAELSQTAAVGSARDETWMLELAGRLALLQHRPEEALSFFQKQETLAMNAVLPHERWRAVVGQARAYEALSREDEALAQHDRAEALTSESLLRVPLGSGRAAFVAQHRRAVREHIALLSRHGNTDEAMRIARRERISALESLGLGSASTQLPPTQRAQLDRELERYWTARQNLDEQVARSWQLPADQAALAQQDRSALASALNEHLDRAFDLSNTHRPSTLPELEPGEMRLLYYPSARGVIGFGQDEQGVVLKELGEIDFHSPAQELGRRLLMPFDDKLQRARRVTVLSMGMVEEISFADLPWQGQPLEETHEVVYSLDLPPNPPSPPESPDRSLVVAVVDPDYDLPGARAEGRVLRTLLGQSSALLRLHESADVSAAALEQELAQARLFHFSGHGKFQGESGWESALVLSEGSRLFATDILALRQAPTTAVLLGCETARASDDVEIGLGLAHAFLLAGSQVVLASHCPLEDARARALSEEIYRDWHGDALSVDSLHRALLRLRKSDPQGDWGSFRILVR